jgi:hypothetical protein
MAGMSWALLLTALHVRLGFVWATVALLGIVNLWILVRWHRELKRMEASLNKELKALMLWMEGKGPYPE